jgi:hypothetical protein
MTDICRSDKRQPISCAMRAMHANRHCTCAAYIVTWLHACRLKTASLLCARGQRLPCSWPRLAFVCRRCSERVHGGGGHTTATGHRSGHEHGGAHRLPQVRCAVHRVCAPSTHRAMYVRVCRRGPQTVLQRASNWVNARLCSYNLDGAHAGVGLHKPCSARARPCAASLCQKSPT